MPKLHRPAQGWRSVRKMLLAVLSLAALAFAGRTAAAQASPNTQAQIAYYNIEVSPEDKVTICPGQKQAFNVYLQKRASLPLSQWRLLVRGGATSIGTLDAQQIQSFVVNQHVGYATPVLQTTGQSGTDIFPKAAFVFKAQDVGTTEIIFSDQGPTGVVGQGRPRVSSETRQVEVKDCKYNIVAFSNWTIPDGFRPHMMSSLGVEVVPDRAGNFRVKTPLDNPAHPTVSIGCTHTITTGATEAEVSGSVDQTNGTIDVEIKYDPVEAVSKIACRGAGSGTKDTAVALTLNPQPLHFRASTSGITAGTLPHTLEAYMTVAGTAAVIVVPEFQ